MYVLYLLSPVCRVPSFPGCVRLLCASCVSPVCVHCPVSCVVLCCAVRAYVVRTLTSLTRLLSFFQNRILDFPLSNPFKSVELFAFCNRHTLGFSWFRFSVTRTLSLAQLCSDTPVFSCPPQSNQFSIEPELGQSELGDSPCFEASEKRGPLFFYAILASRHSLNPSNRQSSNFDR